MKFKECVSYIKEDLREATAHHKKVGFLSFFIKSPGFKVITTYRILRYLRTRKFLRPLSVLVTLIYHHYRYKYGIEISPKVDIGPGFVIHHFGGITIGGETVMGKNCHVRPGLMIGKKHSGTDPVIGDCVIFGTKATVIGDIKIGNNVIIGANSVVTKDVPENSIVAGVPAKLLRTVDCDVRTL